MGWIDALQGKLVALDTAPLIYFIEEHPTYCPVVAPFFEQLDKGTVQIATALDVGASTLLTNDIRWPSVPDLRILTLDSLA